MGTVFRALREPLERFGDRMGERGSGVILKMCLWKMGAWGQELKFRVGSSCPRGVVAVEMGEGRRIDGDPC